MLYNINIQILLSIYKLNSINRHYKLEAELAEVNWRVKWDDIMFGAQEKRKMERSGSRLSLVRVGLLLFNTCLHNSLFRQVAN